MGSPFAFRRWIKTDKGRAIWDSFKLRVPIFGGLVQKTALARFSRTLGSLTRAGVPILESLEIVADTAGNTVVADAVHDCQRGVKGGDSIARPLEQHEVFPPMVVQMMAVGEETGALDEMLDKIADFYESEVEATVDALTSLIEPMLIVVMGVDGRRHDHQPLPAALQHHQAHRVAATVEGCPACAGPMARSRGGPAEAREDRVVPDHAHGPLASPGATSHLGRSRALWWSLAANGGFMVVEIAGGVAFGSLALLADAAHMATDVAGLSIALVAHALMVRPASAWHTYGLQRAEVLGALANGVVLVATAGWILYEAVQRLGSPTDVDGGGVVVVATLGLLVNVGSAILLGRAQGGNLNLRGAYLHMVIDAAGSVAAIVAGLAVVVASCGLG